MNFDGEPISYQVVVQAGDGPKTLELTPTEFETLWRNVDPDAVLYMDAPIPDPRNAA